MKKLSTMIIFCVVLVTLLSCVTNVLVQGPEATLPLAKANFLADINNGDEEAIEKYETKYMDNDVYLFDGPMTVKYCCEKYSLEYAYIEKNFVDSEYDYFQDYFDECIKPFV